MKNALKVRPTGAALRTVTPTLPSASPFSRNRFFSHTASAQNAGLPDGRAPSLPLNAPKGLQRARSKSISFPLPARRNQVAGFSSTPRNFDYRKDILLGIAGYQNYYLSLDLEAATDVSIPLFALQYGDLMALERYKEGFEQHTGTPFKDSDIGQRTWAA